MAVKNVKAIVWKSFKSEAHFKFSSDTDSWSGNTQNQGTNTAVRIFYFPDIWSLNKTKWFEWNHSNACDGIVCVRMHSKTSCWPCFYFCQRNCSAIRKSANFQRLQFVPLPTAKGQIVERRVQKERKWVMYTEKNLSDNCQKWSIILWTFSRFFCQCTMSDAHWHPFFFFLAYCSLPASM